MLVNQFQNHIQVLFTLNFEHGKSKELSYEYYQSMAHQYQFKMITD